MSGPLPGWMAPLTCPAAIVYGRVAAWRIGRMRPRRAPLPVISVGNITAGGVGKSPFVRWLAEALCRDHRHPMIALRGYRAHRRHGSDEANEHRWLLPGVPVVTGADRLAAIERSLAVDDGPDCCILDDGFQHRRLARDLDLVLIDAGRPGLDDRPLPAGWLREPPTALSRADAVIVTRAERVDPALAARIHGLHGAGPIAWTRHAWTGLRRVPAGATAPDAVPVPLDALRGRHVVTLLGIGHPAAFTAQARAAGAIIDRDIPVRDHARYDRRVLRTLREAAGPQRAVLTTQKDWMKLGPLLAGGPGGVEFLVPRLELEFIDGEGALLGRVRRALSESTR